MLRIWLQLLLLLCLPLLCVCQVEVSGLYRIPRVAGVEQAPPRFVLCSGSNTVYFDNGNVLGSFNSAGQYKEYPINASVQWLALDAQENIWLSAFYSDSGQYSLAIFYPENGTLHEISRQFYQPIYWFMADLSEPAAMWFFSGELIFWVNSAGLSELVVTPGHICGLTIGADNNIWFLGHAGSDPKLGKLDVNSTLLTLYDVPDNYDCQPPVQLFNGTDGNLWYYAPDPVPPGSGSTIALPRIIQTNLLGQTLATWYDSDSLGLSQFQLFKETNIDCMFILSRNSLQMYQLSVLGTWTLMSIDFKDPAAITYSDLDHYISVCPNGQFGAPFKTNDGKNSPLLAILQLQTPDTEKKQTKQSTN